MRVEFADVDTIDENLPVVHVVQPHQKVNHGRFSYTRSADQTNHFAFFDRQIYVFKHYIAGIVAKGDVPKFHVSVNLFFNASDAVKLGLLVKNVEYSVNRNEHSHNHSRQAYHPVERRIQHGRIGGKLHKLTCRHCFAQNAHSAEICNKVEPQSHGKREEGEKDSPKRFILILNIGKCL